MNFSARIPNPDAAFISRAEAQMSAIAPATMDAVIAHGAAMLLRNPWRADRIIPAASQMTREEIVAIVDRILPRVTDMNRAIALAQLRRAAEMPGFGPAWAEHRAEAG